MYNLTRKQFTFLNKRAIVPKSETQLYLNYSKPKTEMKA